MRTDHQLSVVQQCKGFDSNALPSSFGGPEKMIAAFTYSRLLGKALAESHSFCTLIGIEHYEWPFDRFSNA